MEDGCTEIRDIHVGCFALKIETIWVKLKEVFVKFEVFKLLCSPYICRRFIWLKQQRMSKEKASSFVPFSDLLMSQNLPLL